MSVSERQVSTQNGENQIKTKNKKEKSMKMQGIIKRVAWLGVIAGLATFNMARADLLFYEGFNYANGVNIETASGVWGNAEGCVIGGGLSFGNLTVSDGAATQNSGTGKPQRNLATPIDSSSAIINDGGTVYLSFLLNENSKAYNNLTLFDGGNERLSIGNVYYYGVSNQYAFRVNNSDYFGSSVDIDLGATHLLLMQLDYSSAGQTKLSLFFDPAGSEGNAIVSHTLDEVLFFNRIRLELNDGSIDEIRMATTLAEALPGLAVPEPSAWALLLTGSGLLLALRRRKS